MSRWDSFSTFVQAEDIFAKTLSKNVAFSCQHLVFACFVSLFHCRLRKIKTQQYLTFCRVLIMLFIISLGGQWTHDSKCVVMTMMMMPDHETCCCCRTQLLWYCCCRRRSCLILPQLLPYAAATTLLLTPQLPHTAAHFIYQFYNLVTIQNDETNNELIMFPQRSSKRVAVREGFCCPSGCKTSKGSTVHVGSNLDRVVVLSAFCSTRRL